MRKLGRLRILKDPAVVDGRWLVLLFDDDWNKVSSQIDIYPYKLKKTIK